MPVIDEIYVRDGNTILPIDSYDNTIIDEIVINDVTYHFAREENVTGTGSAKCANAVEEPLINCVIDGNTVQDGTPIEVQSVGDKTVNLFDVNTYPLVNNRVIYGHNGEYGTVSGYAATSVYIPCTELQGMTITINHTAGANVGIAFYDEDKTYLSGEKYQNATSKTVTVPENAIYYRFSVDADYINEAQVQLGSTVTPYEPYGKYKIPVTARGANIFSMSMVNAKVQTINGITFTPLDDERVHIQGKAIDTTKAVNYQCTRKGTVPIAKGIYRAKSNKYIWSGSGFTIQFGVSNGTSGKNINATYSSVEITMDNGYLNYAQIYMSGKALQNEYDDIIEWQLMKGAENLPFEPYVEPITTNIYIDEPLQGEFNCKDNNITIMTPPAQTLIVEVNTEVTPGLSVDYWKQISPDE